MLPFTCGEKKICYSIRKSQNIMSIVVVKKVDYDAKVLDIESKYFTTADYNKFTDQTLDATMK